MKLKAALSLFLAASHFGTTAQAGPQITWTYQNTMHNECKNVCKRKLAGICVEWGQECNNRSKWFWEDQHKSVMQAAMNRLSQRLSNRAVLDCINQRTRYFRGQSQAQSEMDMSALAFASSWRNINAVAYRVDGNQSGRAYIDRVAGGRRDSSLTGHALDWSRDATIEINLSLMERWFVNREAAIDMVAGTVLHELLHQMGHDHPEGDYNQGHFIVTAGDCVQSNGTTARPAAGLAGIPWVNP